MKLFYKRSTFYILMLSTILMVVLMFLQGRPLTTQATPHGILSLEFAASMPAVEAVIETWKESGETDDELVKVAVNNTKLDFLFLTSYTLFFLAAALQLSLLFEKKVLLQLVAVAALLAGMLDVVENIGMLRSLRGDGSAVTAFVTATAAYIKWILVLLVISSLLLAVLCRIFFRRPA